MTKKAELTKRGGDRIEDPTLEKDMAEAFAFMQGRTKKLTRFKTTRYYVPAPGELKVLRKKLDLSQSQFADLVETSVRTIQGWEQGQRRPDGSTALLLWLVKSHPEVSGWLKERRGQGFESRSPAAKALAVGR